MRRAFALALCATSCGLGGAIGSGHADLPVSGAGPYGKLSDTSLATLADEPYLVEDGLANLSHPTGILTADGAYRVFYARAAKDGTPSEIWVADLPSLHDRVAATARVLGADADWEDGEVSAPDVIDQGGGQLVMYYQSGTTIGRATSSDSGTTWHKTGAVLQNAQAPAVLDGGAAWFLYYTRPDADGIFVALSPDGNAFQAVAEPVLTRRNTDGAAFDEIAVLEPGAVGGMTRAGELHVGLLYVGANSSGIYSIGYAGSSDGLTFERVVGGKPVLDPSSPSERTPAGLLGTTQDVLFYAQDHSGVTAIAGATAP